MMFDDEVPDTSLLPPDECCKCGASPVEIGLFGYPWCEECLYRHAFLTWGQEHGYPALRYTDEAVAYACGEGLFHWLVTALLGGQDYVLKLFVAIDQYTRDHLVTHG